MLTCAILSVREEDASQPLRARPEGRTGSASDNDPRGTPKDRTVSRPGSMEAGVQSATQPGDAAARDGEMEEGERAMSGAVLRTFQGYPGWGCGI